MTLDEALEFFSRYGNVSWDVSKLRSSLSTLTCSQLRAAADHALRTEPIEKVHSAIIAIVWGEL